MFDYLGYLVGYVVTVFNWLFTVRIPLTSTTSASLGNIAIFMFLLPFSLKIFKLFTNRKGDNSVRD